MESETLNPSSIVSVMKTSSWPIIRGSLDDSITFESSMSAVDSASDHAVHFKCKRPLILRRTSPDSPPCDITIHFAHQHEIRQVYVRSTARVYEIYYAADDKGENQYLCTVRCGLAVENEDPVQNSDAVASMSSSYGSNSCEEERHSRTESLSSTNEDGWVDVDPSGLNVGDNSLSNKNESFSVTGNQDLFEATAEISDTDPVKSVTLRLLSIQSGDYIYVDEVYVYADPALAEDVDSSANMPQSSSGNALMSMLVPTLLQLSKSRMSQNQPQNDNFTTERRKNLVAEQKLNSTSSQFQSERMSSSVVPGASVDSYQPVIPVQTTDPQNRPYATTGENTSSFNHVERTLDELVSRISRIEHSCLRFEENILKPINRMEARLEKVEQQLDSLFKNPQPCRMGCSIISGPKFSCKASESNSTSVNGKIGRVQRKADLGDHCFHEEVLIQSSETVLTAVAVQTSDTESIAKNDGFCHENILISPSETYQSANCLELDMPLTSSASHLHPSLVVTAPDFSSIDDDDENDMIETIQDSPKHSPKKRLSIDDALASAISGLLSSASIDPSKCTDIVEENAESPTVERIDDLLVVVSSVIDGSNEPVRVSYSESSLPEVHESLSADNSFVETSIALRQDNLSKEDGEKPFNNYLGNERMKNVCLSIELSSFEVDNETSKALVYDDSNALELAGGNFDLSCSEEVVKKIPDVLQNILQLSVPGTLDFQIPILDVQFMSLENSSSKSPLEALLVDMPESHNQILCIGDDKERAFRETTDFLIVEDGESTTCEASNNQFFFSSNYDSCCLHSNAKEEEQGPYNCIDQNVLASLI